MKKKFLLISILFISFSVYSQENEDAWVFMKDKPNSATFLANPLQMLSQRSIDRREKSNISIDEKDGKGFVEVSAENKADIDAAVKRIKTIVFPPTVEIGDEYEGKVKSIMPYGAFVEIIPGQDGLIHISELEWNRVENVEDVVKQGDLVKFRVTGRDPKTGKVKLSRKVLLPKPENAG